MRPHFVFLATYLFSVLSSTAVQAEVIQMRYFCEVSRPGTEWEVIYKEEPEGEDFYTTHQEYDDFIFRGARTLTLDTEADGRESKSVGLLPEGAAYQANIKLMGHETSPKEKFKDELRLFVQGYKRGESPMHNAAGSYTGSVRFDDWANEKIVECFPESHRKFTDRSALVPVEEGATSVCRTIVEFERFNRGKAFSLVQRITYTAKDGLEWYCYEKRF